MSPVWSGHGLLVVAAVGLLSTDPVNVIRGHTRMQGFSSAIFCNRNNVVHLM
jgi:hypothetical protein